MATGIFLFDQLLTGYTSLSSETSSSAYVTLSIVAWGLLTIIFVFLFIFHRSSSYVYKEIFGLFTTFAFLLLGGIRLMSEREQINYVWNDSPGVYWGEVVTPPVVKGKTLQAEVKVEIQLPSDSSCMSLEDVSQFHGDQQFYLPVNRTILFYWTPDSLQRKVVCGDKILFSSVISQPISYEEVTGFDYATYLYRKGISGTALSFAGEWKVYDRVKSLGIKQFALLCRDRIVSRYREWKLAPDELAVVSALTVGDKSVLTSSLKEMYSAAGVSHVLALSGLHIGILSVILFFFLAPITHFRNGETIRSLLVILFLWSFAFVSGLSPSVVRAVTMCSLYFFATCVLEEKFSGIYALVLAAFLMLIYQPLYLFDLSFQLSFLAVISILYFYPIVSRWISVKNKILHWLWNGIAVSVSAQLGTLPLVLYYFGTFPTYFLLANLLVSVLAICVLSCALLALVASSIPYLNQLTVSALNISTYSLNQSVGWVHQLTGSQIETLGISLLQAICGFLFLYGLYQYSLRKRPIYLLCILSTITITIADWAIRPVLPSSPTLYLTRSHLYIKQRKEVSELTSANGLFTVDTLKIGILTDGRWSHHQAERLIPMDYLYLCRGFKGNLKSLTRVFKIHRIILDSTLSPRYREFLKKESKELKIPYTDLSKEGSYGILL